MFIGVLTTVEFYRTATKLIILVLPKIEARIHVSIA